MTACKFTDCGKRAEGNGFCHAHNEQRRRGKQLTPLRPRGPAQPLPSDIPGTVRIPLSQGCFAIVDETDAAAVSTCRWSLAKRGRRRYANNCRIGYMHRFLWNHWGNPPAQDIDHENRNGLDNRRVNLRGATRAQNMANCPPTAESSSGLKGVYGSNRDGRWRSQIRVDGRQRYLGTFDTKEEAAAAYAEAAKQVYGEFVWRAA